MEDKAAPRFDRPAMVNGTIRRLTRVDIELAKQTAKTDSRTFVANADTNRTVLIVDAHGNDRALEARVRHTRHCEKQLTREERRLINHACDNGTTKRAGQYLRLSYGGPICRFG
jgi:hypothetical protein